MIRCKRIFAAPSNVGRTSVSEGRTFSLSGSREQKEKGLKLVANRLWVGMIKSRSQALGLEDAASSVSPEWTRWAGRLSCRLDSIDSRVSNKIEKFKINWQPQLCGKLDWILLSCLTRSILSKKRLSKKLFASDRWTVETRNCWRMSQKSNRTKHLN